MKGTSKLPKERSKTDSNIARWSRDASKHQYWYCARREDGHTLQTYAHTKTSLRIASRSNNTSSSRDIPVRRVWNTRHRNFLTRISCLQRCRSTRHSESCCTPLNVEFHRSLSHRTPLCKPYLQLKPQKA